jgi:peptidoglycan LD-endopeptidase CwlK
MSAYEGLEPAFAQALNALLADCTVSRVLLHPYFGLRDCVTQAKLWRQSRLTSEIERKRRELVAAGATFLAHCIDIAGPQDGPWATNAIPGMSWHQWGLACDCVWMRAGKGTFDVHVDGANNGYQMMAAKAPLHGLTPLGPAIGDWDHVQLPKESSPLHRYTLAQINTAMEAQFGALVA